MGKLRFLLLASMVVLSSLVLAEPIGTAFTYQGFLQQLGSPANGTFDFQFEMFDVDTDGAALTVPIQMADISVEEGGFTVELDFGASLFSGQQLWLEIGVRDSDDSGAHTILSPRQKLTATPFAVLAATVSAGSINSTSIVDGSVGSAQIENFGVTSIDIDNDAITQSKLASNSVSSAKISDGSITAADVATNQIQRRVTGVCDPGFPLLGINQDGSVVCDPTLPGPGITVDFTDNGAYQSASLAEGIVNVVGSNTLSITNHDGLGIVGGLQSLLLDGGESMSFSFATPVSDVVINDFLAYDTNSSGGIDLQVTIEAFNESNASLGSATTAIDLAFPIEVSVILSISSMSRFDIALDGGGTGVWIPDVADPGCNGWDPGEPYPPRDGPDYPDDIIGDPNDHIGWEQCTYVQVFLDGKDSIQIGSVTFQEVG